MAKKVLNKQIQQTDDSLIMLFITCIHEYLRRSNFMKGPRLIEVQELLKCVYGKHLSLHETGSLVVATYPRLVYMDGGKLRLTQIGLVYFHEHKEQIIPPQTRPQLLKGRQP